MLFLIHLPYLIGIISCRLLSFLSCLDPVPPNSSSLAPKLQSRQYQLSCLHYTTLPAHGSGWQEQTLMLLCSCGLSSASPIITPSPFCWARIISCTGTSPWDDAHILGAVPAAQFPVSHRKFPVFHSLSWLWKGGTRVLCTGVESTACLHAWP